MTQYQGNLVMKTSIRLFASILCIMVWLLFCASLSLKTEENWYGDYPSGSVTDPQGPVSGRIRVNRVGSWWWFARFCRSANRIRYMPFDHTEDIGFRLAMTPEPG